MTNPMNYKTRALSIILALGPINVWAGSRISKNDLGLRDTPLSIMGSQGITAVGPSGSGGGNTLDNKMIESYAEPIESFDDYGSWLKPLIENLKYEMPGLGRLIERGATRAIWYLIPRNFPKLPPEKTGLYFDTDQTGYQLNCEVFIQKRRFRKLPQNEKRKFLVHESIECAIAAATGRDPDPQIMALIRKIGIALSMPFSSGKELQESIGYFVSRTDIQSAQWYLGSVLKDVEGICKREPLTGSKQSKTYRTIEELLQTKLISGRNSPNSWEKNELESFFGMDQYPNSYFEVRNDLPRLTSHTGEPLVLRDLFWNRRFEDLSLLCESISRWLTTNGDDSNR